MKQGFLLGKPKAKAPAKQPSSSTADTNTRPTLANAAPVASAAPSAASATESKATSTAAETRADQDAMQALAQRAAELSLAAAAAPTCLPPELFWEIALQHLDSQDLLNMALCSRTMHSLLAPQLRAHTFAFAKATPRATPASARLIKHFTHSWTKHDTFPANRATREAYAKSFERAVNVQRVTYMGRTGCVDMWATLCKASESSLREVQIASRSPLVEFHMNKDLPLFFNYTGAQPALEQFAFYSRSERGIVFELDPPTFPLHRQCVLGLQAMKNLRILRLGNFNARGEWAIPIDATQLLARGHWEHLEVLELSHFYCTSPQIVSSFFARHPKIHTLDIPDIYPEVDKSISLEALGPDALPNIRHLCAGMYNVLHFLGTVRPTLKSLAGLQLDLLYRKAEEIDLSFGPTMLAKHDVQDREVWSRNPMGLELLVRLMRNTSIEELDVWSRGKMMVQDLIALGKMAPQLKRFRTLKNCTPIGDLNTWVTAFKHMPQLEDIAWPIAVFFAMEYRPIDEPEVTLIEQASMIPTARIEEAAKRLAEESLPKLKSIQLFQPERAPELKNCIVIHRNAASNKVEKVELTKRPAWMRAADEDVRASKPTVSAY